MIYIAKLKKIWPKFLAAMDQNVHKDSDSPMQFLKYNDLILPHKF